jgi:aminomethyltransferase
VSSSSDVSTAKVRKTALNAVHRQMRAKMVDFNGWDMPVEYPAGLIAEHLAVRSGVGIFDVSHMGDIRVSGRQALQAVQHITMNDASKLQIGQCQYSAMLYPQGTFVDDVIVHRFGDSDFYFVINAGTREKDIAWVRENTRSFDCKVEHLSDDFTQIAIQGPRGVDVLQKLTDADLSKVKFYWFTRGTVCGLKDTLIARTGYTAEGKEYNLLPCGLGARNTLRLEGKLALYGHEISDSITVWEAGLDRWLKMDKGEFIGRKSLERQQADGITRTLVGLEMIERGIGRDGYKVLDESGKQIGSVTSGSYEPFLKKNIALAYVPPSLSKLDTVVGVEIRGNAVKAKVVPTPFYKRPPRKKD